MADLASLVVSLTAETSQYTAAIKKATDDITGFADTVGSSIGDIVQNLLALEALKQAFDFTENIAKTMAGFELLSSAVGATTEELSQLSFAGKLEGVDDISFALERLARAVGQVQEGNAKLTSIFSALGVSTTDASGKLKSTQQQLLDIADAVSKYSDGLGKTAAVQQIFGRSGADFIAFLDQGAAKIREAQQEAVDLGVSVDSESGKAALAFEQNMTRIGAAFEGVFFKALQQALPALQQLTDSMVTFSKNASNTAPVVDELAAGLKIIASALIIIGAGFETAGRTIAAVVFEIVTEVTGLYDAITTGPSDDTLKSLETEFGVLYDALTPVTNAFSGFYDEIKDLEAVFTDPLTAIKSFIDDIEDLGNIILHPIDSIKSLTTWLGTFVPSFGSPSNAISSFEDKLDELADVFLHPIRAFDSFVAGAAKDIGLLVLAFNSPIQAAKKFIDDLTNSFKDSNLGYAFAPLVNGLNAVEDLWGVAVKKVNDTTDTIKKPDLNLINLTQVNAIASAIEALGKFNDALNQQVATYGLNGAAVTAYDLTLGKLSASIAEVNKANPAQLNDALKKAEDQGKLTATSIAEIKAAIEAGVPPAQAFEDSILGSSNALDKIKGADALSKLDSQLLTMTNHLKEASQAATDLANRPLAITVQTQVDRQTFSGVDDSQKQIQVQQQLNALNQQAADIEDKLGAKIDEVNAAGVAGNESQLQIAGEQAVARQNALADLEQLYVKTQALANVSTGVSLKAATEQAKELQAEMAAIQFNPSIIADAKTLTELQKQQLELTKQDSLANADLEAQLSALALQNSQGSLSDLDYMKQQDAARQHAIDTLNDLENAQLDILADNPGNPAALAEYDKLSKQITTVESQMGQLAKTVRTDLTDDLANAFVGFATGAESAQKALQTFVADFYKQMLELAAKQLFQKLFDATGITAGINSLFGTATGAASSAAGATAAGTTIGGAMTLAGGTAADAMSVAIIAAGTEAATEMGTAIEAASAGADAYSGFSAAASLGGAAEGGPIPANQLTLVGEKGPELFVSDAGAETGATSTKTGSAIPEDLTHAHVIGVDGPEFIEPNVSGFVVPSDVFLDALSDRTQIQATPQAAAGPDTGAVPVAPDSEGLSAPQVADTGAIPVAPDSEGLSVLQASDVTQFTAGAQGDSQALGSSSQGESERHYSVPEIAQKLDIQSPAIPSQPEPIAQVPDVFVSTVLPETVGSLPEPVAPLPETVGELPEPVSQLPQLVEQAPDVVSQLPQPVEQAPDVVSQLPQPVEQAPDVVSQLPQPVEQAPDVVAQLPEPVERVPEAVSQLPAPISTTAALDDLVARVPEAIAVSRTEQAIPAAPVTSPVVQAPDVQSTATQVIQAIQAEAQDVGVTQAQAPLGIVPPVPAAPEAGLLPEASPTTTAQAIDVDTQAPPPDSLAAVLQQTTAQAIEASTPPVIPELATAPEPIQTVAQAIAAPTAREASQVATPVSQTTINNQTVASATAPQTQSQPIDVSTEPARISQAASIPGESVIDQLRPAIAQQVIVSEAPYIPDAPSIPGASGTLETTIGTLTQPPPTGPAEPFGQPYPYYTPSNQSSVDANYVASPPNPDSYTFLENGVQTPIGLTETFTTDTEGPNTFVTISENQGAYAGEVLPADTTTGSGDTTLTQADIFYPPGSETPDQFQGIYDNPDQLAQSTDITMAEYFAQFGGTGTGNQAPVTPSQVTGPVQPGREKPVAELPESPALTLPELQAVTPIPETPKPLLNTELPAAKLNQTIDSNAASSVISPTFEPLGTDVLDQEIHKAEGYVAPTVPAQQTKSNVIQFPTPAAVASSGESLPDVAAVTGRETQNNVIAFPTPAAVVAPAEAIHGEKVTQAESSDNVIAFPTPAAVAAPAESIPEVANAQEPHAPSASIIAFPTREHTGTTEPATPQESLATTSSFGIGDNAQIETSSNVIAFPTPAAPVQGAEFASSLLDIADELPSAPQRIDTEVTHAQAPVVPVSLDAPTADVIVQFEKIVNLEQAQPTLNAHEYEEMLTDRYLQKRAGGGPVTAGTPYLVGEGGPELMVPDSSGTVLNTWSPSQDSIQQSIVHQTLNFYVQTQTGKIDRASQGQIAARTAMAVQAGGRNN